MLHHVRFLAAAMLMLGVARTAPSQQPTPKAAPASNKAADAQWLMPAHDYAATRFSALGDITPVSVTRLRAAWSFSTGVLGGHEGQPLVVGQTMYVVTPYPNVLYAFDLTREGYPLRWKYRPWVNPVAIGIACCDVVNRGAVYAEGKIIYNLLDGHTVAVDTATGREVWKTEVADVRRGETTPMAPLVVKNRVLVGTSGGEYGVRGWLKALDLSTGRLLWTGYSIGPDSDVLAPRATFRTPYDSGADLGVRTWSGDSWQHGGAPVWGWLSYDPALDLLYYGTGNAAPWNSDQRGGDNKWAASVLARSPDDGTLRWAYQFTPGDGWDYDATQEMILADLAVGGRTRKTLVHFDKNGFAYTLDRGTGEVLVAAPYVPTTWATGVDLASGRPTVNPAKLTGASKGNVTDICPTLEGGKNQQPAAYSPVTGLFYVPTTNMCMDFAANAVTYIAGTPFMGATTPYRAGPGGNLGAFIAWDAARGRRVWEIKEPYPVWGGALVTGGGVVFYGTLDGWFKAADARSGAVLWKFKVGSGVVGNPVTFRGSDGKQYVAIYAGIGGDWFLLSGDVRADDPADVRPPASFMPDIARYTSQGGIVWLFSL